MGPIRQKNDPLRLFLRRVLMLIVAAAVVFGISGVWGVYGKERDSRILREKEELRLANLEEQSVSLEQKLSQLETERGKEEALREQYAVGREGERLIIIVEPKIPPPLQATSTFREWVGKYLPFW